MSSSVLEQTVSGGFTDYGRGRGGEGTYVAMQLTLTRSLLPSGSVYKWSAPKMMFALIAGTKPGTEIIVPAFVTCSRRVSVFHATCGRGGQDRRIA